MWWCGFAPAPEGSWVVYQGTVYADPRLLALWRRLYKTDTPRVLFTARLLDLGWVERLLALHTRDEWTDDDITIAYGRSIFTGLPSTLGE